MGKPNEEIQSTVDNLIAAGSRKGVVLTALTQITIDLVEKMRQEKDWP